jgi:hypothetical protein
MTVKTEMTATEKRNWCIAKNGGKKRAAIADTLGKLERAEKELKNLKTLITSGFHYGMTPPAKLLQMFWQRSSDACPLECTSAEKEEELFEKWVISEQFYLTT